MKKKTVVVLMILILLTGVLAACTGKEAKEADGKPVEDEKYTPVEIEKAEPRTISNETFFNGKVQPNKEVTIVPKTPGKVAQLNVKVGTDVKAGTLLFAMEAKDIQKQVDQARISISSAKANYARVEEQVENSRANLERTRQLYEQGAVPLTQYEQALLAASDKPLDGARIQIEQAELAYQQAVESVKDTAVSSPISGTVVAVNIEVGEMASSAQPAVVVADLSRLNVKIDVPENMVNEVKVGQEVAIYVNAVSDSSFKGKVETISPTADSRTNLYGVEIYIDNKEQKIKPGMFGKIQLNTRVKENVIAVKGEAIIQRGEKAFVYIVENNQAVEKEVVKGLDTGAYIEILQGLGKGEQVIVKGQHYVENGSIVKVVRSEQ